MMKLTLLAVLTFTAISSIIDNEEAILQNVIDNQSFDLNIGFEAYTRNFEKTYVSSSEKKLAFDAFVLSVDRIREMNQANHGATFALNQFSDMHSKHFANNFLTYKTVRRVVSEASLRTSSQQTKSTGKVDWRNTKGVVSAVKNQNKCGSCFAYSAVETVESAFVMNGGSPRALSVEQIVGCDKVDKGCQGGDSVTAYKFIKSSGGLLSNKDYPDLSVKTGKTPKCLIGTSITKDDVTSKLVKIDKFVAVVPQCSSTSCSSHSKYEPTLANAIKTNGPASICISANWGWQDYVSGILNSPKCKNGAYDIDHCVQVVGFDADYSTPYWIVRNSWSSTWGEHGYIRIAMGSNMCGITNEAMQVKASEGNSLELPKISSEIIDVDEYEYETCQVWFWQFTPNDRSDYEFCNTKDLIINFILIIFILVLALTLLLAVIQFIAKTFFGVMCCTAETLLCVLSLRYCCGMCRYRRNNDNSSSSSSVDVKYYYVVHAYDK
jgi:hypothetical protein